MIKLNKNILKKKHDHVTGFNIFESENEKTVLGFSNHNTSNQVKLEYIEKLVEIAFDMVAISNSIADEYKKYSKGFNKEKIDLLKSKREFLSDAAVKIMDFCKKNT